MVFLLFVIFVLSFCFNSLLFRSAFIISLVEFYLLPVANILLIGLWGDYWWNYLILLAFAKFFMIVALNKDLSLLRGQQNQWIALFVFGFFFLSTSFALRSFSDIYPIGERMRDFAVMSEVIKNFVSPQEPWLSGHELNYYSFHYRFSHFIHKFSGSELFLTYRYSLCWAFSAFISLLFLFITQYTNRSMLALLGSFTVGLGVNLSALKNGFGTLNFWSNSRLVEQEGLITEFPAWSFLLGDAHPHFLGLPLTVLGLLGLRWFYNQARLNRGLFIGAVVSFAVLLYTSNPWELISFSLLFGLFCIFRRHALLKLLFQRSQRVFSIENLSFVSLNLSLLYGLNSPNASLNIGNSLVLSYKTLSFHIFEHFIIWVIAGCLVFGFSFLSIGLIVILFKYFMTSIPFLIFQLREKIRTERIEFEALLLIAGVSLLLIPDILYIDDAYAGKHERMNTIFKFFFSSWVFIGLGLTGLLIRKRAYSVGFIYMSVILGISFPWYYKVIKKRINWDSKFSRLEYRYPGLRDMVTNLSRSSSLTIIEPEGKAYSDGNMVSILSGNRSFLGWSNHVNLLTRKWDETRARSAILKKVYSDLPCPKRKSLLEEIRWDSLIVYPNSRSNWKCFGRVRQYGGFKVYFSSSF